MIFTGLSQAARGHLAMLAFSALVAGSFSLGAMAARFVSPSALTVARFALAGSGGQRNPLALSR